MNERLYPPRCHPRWFTLTRLRQHLEKVLLGLPSRKNQRVLDYGCGGMPYRPLVQKIWPDVSFDGADLAHNPKAAIAITEKGELQAPSAAYDLVLSTQVLEHVADPARYLGEACRVLRTGGQLLISTHGYWMYHPDPTDYWRWTGDGLRKIVAEAGLTVTETLGVGNLASAAVQLFQDATFWRVYTPVRPAYAFAAQRSASVFCRLFGGDSTSDAIIYLVIATKQSG